MLSRLFGRKGKGQIATREKDGQTEAVTDGRETIPEAWLFDAPLFVDDYRIKSLYNAVALPEYERECVTMSTKDVKVSKWTAGGQVEVSAGDSLLAQILAPISAKATVKGDRGGEKTHGTEDTWKLTAVDAAERRLTNLAIHYAANLKSRVWNVIGLEDDAWLKAARLETIAPKPLVFIDVEPGRTIMPMAAELGNGNVVRFFSEFGSAVIKAGGTAPPPYPITDAGPEANAFWSWFADNKPGGKDPSLLLMDLIEDQIGNGGRLRWINCRVPVGPPHSQFESLHLDIKTRGEYDTGDFAYHFLHRGKKHGFRVVGTLKAGPALNVLALYEK